jgi:L-2,4-diaminobutyrate decarboxylase
VLRYRPTGAVLAEPELALLNNRIRTALWERGTAVVAATKVDGRQFLKLTLLNPKTTLADVLAIVEQVRLAGEEALDEQAA